VTYSIYRQAQGGRPLAALAGAASPAPSDRPGITHAIHYAQFCGRPDAASRLDWHA
jgi:hypothetical protein